MLAATILFPALLLARLVQRIHQAERFRLADSDKLGSVVALAPIWTDLQNPPAWQGFSVGAPRFELGTSSPPD